MHMDLMIVLLGSHTKIVRRTKQIAATLGVISGCFGVAMGAPVAVGGRHAFQD